MREPPKGPTVNARKGRDCCRVVKLRIRGFKSVGREPLMIDLGPSHGLVAIVGPNGAGKSNVLDAMCFAMGPSTSGCGQRVNHLADVRNADVQEVRRRVGRTLTACGS